MYNYMYVCMYLAIYMSVCFLSNHGCGGYQMWISGYATGAWHNKSLEQNFQRTACFQAAEYYLKCALIIDIANRLDAWLCTCS